MVRSLTICLIVMAAVGCGNGVELPPAQTSPPSAAAIASPSPAASPRTGVAPAQRPMATPSPRAGVTPSPTEIPPSQAAPIPTATPGIVANPTPTPSPATQALPSPTATQATQITPSPTATPGIRIDPTATETVAIPDIAVLDAFPTLGSSFGSRPLFFAEVPDGSARAVVVDQRGSVNLVSLSDPAAPSRIFLDISDRVSTAGNEEGLLGLAFDPGYASNGRVYVYYSAANPRRSVISRFAADPAAGRADSGTEEVILQIDQPYSNHNGGMIEFGPDGYLYVGLGDGGSGGDPLGHGQNLSTLLGSILRIDPVGGEQKYRVPGDNPFVGRPTAEARPEIWAYGFRNPFRFSFDRKTGELWAGDVGQSAWEEIDVVVKGGNYGWNLMEGSACYRTTPCDSSDLIQPVAEYSTRQYGCAVTGGYVYRGRAISGLDGVYLYGDFCSGIIWGLRRVDGKVVAARQLLDTPLQISSFGQDLAGEIYLTAFDGRVYRVVVSP